MAHIDYKTLKENGIKFIVFDKDNTLTVPYVREYFDKTLEEAIISDCQRIFGEENTALLSNSVGSRDDPENKEAKIVEKTLGLQVIRHEKKKPAVRDDILLHFADRVEN